MGRERFVLVWLTIVCLAVVAGCVSGRTKSVDNAYSKRIYARISGYDTQAQEINNRIATMVRSTSSGQASYSPTTLVNTAFELARVSTRASIASRFMNEAAASGQVGSMGSWLSHAASQAIELSHQADDRTAALQAQAAAHADRKYISDEVVEIILMRGAVQGAAQEIQTLNDDLAGYSVDYANARREDAEASARFAAALSTLSTIAYQQQSLANQRAMVNALNRPVTCSAFGNYVRCD